MNEVYLRPDLAERFREQDPFVWVDRLQGRVFRQVARRRTLRVKLDGEVLFLKRHHGVGWIEIVKNLLLGRLPVLGAGNEFRAARALIAAGISVPEPVAYAERGDSPSSRESFILSRAIEPSISLEDLAKRWRKDRPPAVVRWQVFDQVTLMVASMHNAGVNHRDLYICHFLLPVLASGTQLTVDGQKSAQRDAESIDARALSSLTLIDLHRAQVRVNVPKRWLIKDLAALWFSAADTLPTRRDAYRFIRKYSGRSLRDELAEPHRAAFWRAVGERAQKLHSEARRKGLQSFDDPFATAFSGTGVRRDASE